MVDALLLQLGQPRLALLENLERLGAHRESVLEHGDQLLAAGRFGLVDLGLQPQQRATHGRIAIRGAR